MGLVAAMLLPKRRAISLHDKTVFVTGGSRGLGFVLAREFAHRGAKVAVSARDASELKRAETQLKEISDRVVLPLPVMPRISV
jgi:NAD(P)-dependent dehydrogenase (short-subunit alcohol dehydrogenase family)